MANSEATYKELRFKIKDESTEAFVFIESPDFHLAHGWKFKSFPASVSVIDIIKSFTAESPVLWPNGAP